MEQGGQINTVLLLVLVLSCVAACWLCLCVGWAVCLDSNKRRLLLLLLVEVDLTWTIAARSKYCSTAGHRDVAIWAWSVYADAWRPALAGYSSASAVQACCDSPSLSSPPNSTVPCRLLYASLRSSWMVPSICDLPDVINCRFREFDVAPLGLVLFL